jgi:hypothetical protein
VSDQPSNTNYVIANFRCTQSSTLLIFTLKIDTCSSRRQVWTALTVFDTPERVQLTHSFTWKHSKGLKPNDTARELHLKVINQDVRIYVNIHTALDIDVTDIHCEGFSITHFCLSVFYPLYHILPCFPH